MKRTMPLATATLRAGAFALSVLLWTLPASDAQAYVDPGTGSMLLQMGAAALAAGLFYLRSFRNWLSSLFRGKRRDDGTNSN